MNNDLLDLNTKYATQVNRIPTIGQKDQGNGSVPLTEFQRTPINELIKLEQQTTDYNILKNAKP